MERNSDQEISLSRRVDPVHLQQRGCLLKEQAKEFVQCDHRSSIVDSVTISIESGAYLTIHPAMLSVNILLR